MGKRILLIGAGIAVIHFLLSIGSVAVAFSSGMEAFGNPDYLPSMVERVANIPRKHHDATRYVPVDSMDERAHARCG